MKKLFATALLLLIAASVHATPPYISEVLAWGDGSVTVRVQTYDEALSPDIVAEVLYDETPICDVFIDCPLLEYSWAQILMGDPSRGCQLMCSQKYSFRVRSSSDLNWSNELHITTESCTN